MLNLSGFQRYHVRSLEVRKQTSSFSARYGAALACLVLALAVRWSLSPLLGSRNPYITVFIAVLLVSRFWGLGPGLLVGIAGAAAATRLFGQPGRPLAQVPDSLGLGLFLVSTIVAVWIIDLLRRASERASLSAMLADQRLNELRERNAEREQQQKISALFSAIVESSADAIISETPDGVIQSWNSGASHIFGYAPSEAIGQNIRLLVPPGRLAESQGLIARVRDGARVTQFETMRVRKDGSEIPVSLTISPIRDEAGKVAGMSQIARDISGQKELEQQLRQTQKLESLGVLAGGLAHDFNNLLTGIMGNASLAAGELDDIETARGRIQEVLSASERAALLVRQMLAYAGKGRFLREPLNLSTQIQEIVALLRSSISHSVELDLQLGPDLPTIVGDRAQLQQVIMNLAINAAEAMAERPGRLTIATRSRESNGERQVVLEVIDRGVGMDEETKARIFDPFFTTKFTGRGLGLSAVMGIARSHNATVSVESTPGQGSRFEVVFPASAAPAITEVPAGQDADLQGSGIILVVDDEELVRRMARFTLERCGYRVELAPDGKKGVDLFAGRPGEFAVVLLDLTMPVMNGEEALRHIRRIRPEVPVVLSSGFSEGEALQRFRDSGRLGYLQKPYTATDLARSIKEAVER